MDCNAGVFLLTSYSMYLIFMCMGRDLPHAAMGMNTGRCQEDLGVLQLQEREMRGTL